MAAMTCPYCTAYADMVQRAALGGVQVPGRGGIQFAVWQCAACGMFVLGELGSPSGTPNNYVPRPSAVRAEFTHVPEHIAEDAREAVLCHQVGAWRASAAMARRALQAAAYEKGAPNRKLVDQIDALADAGVITTQLKDVAHQIRLGGNLGAHPDRDGIKDVDEDAAGRILRFMSQFFTYVYTIPGQLDEVAGGGSPPA